MPAFNPIPAIKGLAQNEATFLALFDHLTPEEQLWRPQHDKWNMLEILCHMLDEEREDFRARLHSVIEDPNQPFTPIDPEGWVTSRNYASKSYDDTLQQFVAERKKSITWLNSLTVPDWNIAYHHPKFGPMSAAFLLNNWLAHDYLHIRQITRYKFTYLEQNNGGTSLAYAGGW